MSKKLPKTVYGYWREEGTEDEYFSSDPDPATTVEKGETLRVGVYERVGEVEVVNKTVAGPVKKRKK